MVDDINRAAGRGLCTVMFYCLFIFLPTLTLSTIHILCKHLESDFGVTGVALRWLTSFVSDRSQYVAIGSERSEMCALLSGVSQGSVLGPLLFALYTSEVDEVIESYAVQYHQHADDLMINLSHQTSYNV